MLPALMIALATNRPVVDLDGFIAGRAYQTGVTRSVPEVSHTISYQKPLVVDDSIHSGGSLKRAKEQLSVHAARPTFLAVYAHKRSRDMVDFALELVDMPRVFEWHMWHRREFCANSCFDLDGVLCVDPTDEENDDGLTYMRFIQTARQLVRPGYPLGHIVTSRLEKYRKPTEEWLASKGICFEQLHMLDLPSAEERRRGGVHAQFKAEVFKHVNGCCFVESEPSQAIEIYERSGLPVLCFKDMQYYAPGWRSPGYIRKVSATFIDRAVNKVVGRARSYRNRLVSRSARESQ